MRIFLDTNVVMDFCAKRMPFFEDASLIIDMGYRKEICMIVSALTFINVAYVLRKVYPKELVMAKLKSLADICVISPIEGETILNGIQMQAKDFEDSVQYLSALKCGADVIVTRDMKGFENFPIRTMTPVAFLESASY